MNSESAKVYLLWERDNTAFQSGSRMVGIFTTRGLADQAKDVCDKRNAWFSYDIREWNDVDKVPVK